MESRPLIEVIAPLIEGMTIEVDDEDEVVTNVAIILNTSSISGRTPGSIIPLRSIGTDAVVYAGMLTCAMHLFQINWSRD